MVLASQRIEEYGGIEMKHNQRRRKKMVREKQMDIASSKALSSRGQPGTDPLQGHHLLYHYFSLFKMEDSGVPNWREPGSQTFPPPSPNGRGNSSIST
jgi:hypothetical protein